MTWLHVTAGILAGLTAGFLAGTLQRKREHAQARELLAMQRETFQSFAQACQYLLNAIDGIQKRADRLSSAPPQVTRVEPPKEEATP